LTRAAERLRFWVISRITGLSERFGRVLLGAVLGVAVAGCAAAAPEAAPVRLAVSPRLSVASAPIRIVIAGLSPGERATLRISSVDADNFTWQSSATYRASRAGTINPAVMAPVAGSYTGISAMGPIWSMQPTTADSLEAYYWSQDYPQSFTATVTVHGTVVARVPFSRELEGSGVEEQVETLSANGFAGRFFQPRPAARGNTAVLVIGGSEGGYPGLISPLLADAGYPTLGIAYFDEPGLPSTLSKIPLEYFATALRWLARQPGVDPDRIAVIGVSRGSEAAQLLGVYYPSLVRAVVASVPSNVAICSYPHCDGPAWMHSGRPVPYTSQFDDPDPTDDPAAVIQDQRIQGPVFLDCAQDDETWTSCPYAEAIMRLLDAHHDHWKHVLYSYPGAGHLLGSLVPYEPSTTLTPADESDLPGLWQHLLSFLAAVPAGHG
jgi:dienelactone hydrolase